MTEHLRLGDARPEGDFARRDVGEAALREQFPRGLQHERPDRRRAAPGAGSSSVNNPTIFAHSGVSAKPDAPGQPFLNII